MQPTLYRLLFIMFILFIIYSLNNYTYLWYVQEIYMTVHARARYEKIRKNIVTVSDYFPRVHRISGQNYM